MANTNQSSRWPNSIDCSNQCHKLTNSEPPHWLIFGFHFFELDIVPYTHHYHHHPTATTTMCINMCNMYFWQNYFQHVITQLKTHPELDPNAPNGLGDAPIHAIVKKAHSKAERAEKVATLYNLLVYSNANVDATASYGMTALHMAANVGNLTQRP